LVYKLAKLFPVMLAGTDVLTSDKSSSENILVLAFTNKSLTSL